MAESAFYLPLGEDRFLATAHTAGPWDPHAQHFGPPSALLTRALENLGGERETTLARVTVEILGPAPLAEYTVRAEVVRPGRSVELLTAELAADTDGGQRTVARAWGWRFAVSDTDSVATLASDAWPKPDECPPAHWPEGGSPVVTWRRRNGEPSRAARTRSARRRSGHGNSYRWSTARSPARYSGWSPSPMWATECPTAWIRRGGCSSTAS